MESKYDRFLRLRSTLERIEENQISLGQFTSKLEAAEIELTQSLKYLKSADSKITAMENKKNLNIEEIKKEIKQEVKKIDQEVKINKQVMAEKHRKLGNLTWDEYIKILPQKYNPKLEEKLIGWFVFCVSFGLIFLIWSPEELDTMGDSLNSIFDYFEYCCWGFLVLFSASSAWVTLTENIEVTEKGTESFVKRKIKKHTDLETRYKNAKTKIWKLKGIKKRTLHRLDDISELLSTRSKETKKIEELGEEIVVHAEQITKLQSKISDEWESIIDMIPTDSATMFPKQLKD